MAKKKQYPEFVSGLYAPLPHAVLDCVAFQGAGYPSRALLFELVRQHNGRNNGHLQLTMGWLKRRGWNSVDVVDRARNQLIDRRLIVETRKGGLNNGASLFAVTWLPITNFMGLDMQSREYRLGTYSAMNPMPKVKVPGLANGPSNSASRSSSDPVAGADITTADPSHGSKKATFDVGADPFPGNNETIAIPSSKGRRLLLVS
jgi:hypothetical protein